jgi:uncharacterized membrane protein YqhA
MEKLQELKRAIVSDGHLSVQDVELLRSSLFNEEGMTKEKANFLFNLKDTISKEHLISEFKELFVEAISVFLLEDEESPGEIDDSEAKWLRAKIQTKGYQDNVDISLLDNLRKKSINYPEILNFKGKMARKFEGLLFYSRYLSIFAVIGSLLSACALFIRGSEVVIRGLVDFFKTNGFKYHGEYEKLIEAFVSSVDIYLFAMVLIIFGMGVYELFINKIDPVEKKVDSRPSWLQISSIDELKSSLGKVILMVLIVSFFKHSLDIEYHSATDLLLLATGILLLAGALFIANYHHKDKSK